MGLLMMDFKKELESINSIKNEEQKEAHMAVFVGKAQVAVEEFSRMEELRDKLMEFSPEDDLNTRLEIMEAYVCKSMEINGTGWTEAMELLAENCIEDAQFHLGMYYLAHDGLARKGLKKDCDDNRELKGLQWIWTAAASGFLPAIHMKEQLVEGEKFNNDLFSEIDEIAKLNKERCGIASLLNREWLHRMKKVQAQWKRKKEGKR